MNRLLFLLFLFLPVAAFTQGRNKQLIAADSLARNEEHAKAFSLYEKVLKEEPGNEEALRGLGVCYIVLGKLDEGEKFYNETLKSNVTCASCYAALGSIYAMKKELDKGLSMLDKSISLKQQAYVYELRAQVKKLKDDKLGALQDYSKAVELEPNDPNYLVKRGDFRMNSGYPSMAMRDYEKVIELFPNDPTGYYKRADIYFSQQLNAEALADMNKAIQLDSTIADLYTARGSVYSAMNENEKAMKDYNTAIRLDAEPTAYLNRSMLKYSFEDMDGACEDLLKGRELAMKIDTNHPIIPTLQLSIDDYCDSTKASYYYQRGIAYYNLGEYDKAVSIYTKGLKKFPGNPLSLSFRGNAYYAKGDYKNAIADYQSFMSNKDKLHDEVKNNPRFQDDQKAVEQYITASVSANYLYISECKLMTGDNEGALKDISKGIETAPPLSQLGPEVYLFTRGNIYMAMGKYKEAIDDYNAAILQDPSYYLSYVNRAAARMSLSSQSTTVAAVIKANKNGAPQVSTGWTMPVNIPKKKNDNLLNLALSDCSKAIELQPQAGYAYYMRGYVKQMLELPDHCYDYLKARSLNYPVEPELLKGCK
jgi:tetratricopeptide (TPR) repeat protein